MPAVIEAMRDEQEVQLQGYVEAEIYEVLVLHDLLARALVLLEIDAREDLLSHHQQDEHRYYYDLGDLHVTSKDVLALHDALLEGH